MRKFLSILLVVAIILLIATIYFSPFGTIKQTLLSRVPQTAKSVIIVNLKALSTKLFFDELTSRSKHAEKLAKIMPDSLASIDWLASGISLSEKAVFFSAEGNSPDSLGFHLLIPIENSQKFQGFVDSLSKTINLKAINEKMIWSDHFKSLIAWDDDFVLFSFFSKNKVRAAKFSKNILHLKKDVSIMTDSSFMLKQTANFDILIYSKPYKQYPKKQSKFIQNNIESVISFLHFNDGELKIKSELTPVSRSLLERLFTIDKKPLPELSIVDSSILKANFAVEPGYFFEIANQLTDIKFNNKKIPILAAWDGRARLLLKGSKTINNEYISYEFDDDFNKVERKTITKEKIWDVRAILGVNEDCLDSVFNNTQLFKSGKDTLLFKGSKFITKKIANSYLCYNRYINQPKIQKKTKLDNIFIQFNYNQLSSIINKSSIETPVFFIDSTAIESFSMRINKNLAIDISANILFKNKKKNAFFSITELFIKSKKNTQSTNK